MKQFQLLILYYLRFWAKLQLKKNNPTIIGITGSAGKTSCAAAIEAIFKDYYKIKSSRAANSETGLPLNILGFPNWFYTTLDWLWVIPLSLIKLVANWKRYQIYIAEMSIDSPYSPKNMGYLLTIFQPKIGVFLNVSTVHSEPFDHLVTETDPPKRTEKIIKLIAAEKGKLIENLPSDGTAILNIDDPNVYALKSKTKAKVITFGTNPKATIQIRQVEPSLTGTTIVFLYQTKEYKLKFSAIVLSTLYGHTFAAALAAALAFKIPFKKAIESLQKNYQHPNGRMSLVPGINHSYILDSSYNASPQPVLDALNLLNQIAPRRKLALLADMREMGQEARRAHQQVVQKAAAICDQLYLVGPLMQEYALSNQSVTRPNHIRWFASAKDAIPIIREDLRKDDTLLVKGSQNTIFLEYAVERLMADPSKADKLLCRRGKFWDQKRTAIGLV